MTTDYLYELQQSVIAALATDYTLNSIVNGIYNHVPLEAKFPYVAVDNIIAKDANTRTSNGFHIGMAIRVFSRARTSREASNIVAEIRRILASVVLEPTGCKVSSIREAEDSFTRMGDGSTWHGSISYLVILQQGSSTFVADGSQLILKIGNGATPTEVFTEIGGLRNASITIANKTLDASNIAAGKWRKMVSGAGIAHASISGIGFFTDSGAEESMRANAFLGNLNNYQILLGNNDKITGSFMVSAYKRNGSQNMEEEVAVLLESSGEVVFG